MTRKIIIISNKTQSQHILENSCANTLGELKAELNAVGIDHEGMSFFEGHARVELKDDASILPTNIPYKGEIVNDLTFLLSAPNKKIKSGMYTRVELYNLIKSNHLETKVIEKFGRNMTQVKTGDLCALLDAHTKSKKVASAQESDKKQAAKTSKTSETRYPVTTEFIAKAVKALVKVLRHSGAITGDSAAGILSLLQGDDWEIPEGMTKEEIDQMFNFVNRN